jgi:hypothetical protein
MSARKSSGGAIRPISCQAFALPFLLKTENWQPKTESSSLATVLLPIKKWKISVCHRLQLQTSATIVELCVKLALENDPKIAQHMEMTVSHRK